MPSATTALMTFAELERLPDSAVRYELRHGEPIALPPPKHKHFRIQQNLLDALRKAAAGSGRNATEFGFRPNPEYEYWIADVAFISRERWLNIPDEGYFQGVPEIVIEVLSPSNTASEMLDREQVCLENGGREFWVVDPVRSQVKVSTADGHSVTYKRGQSIPLLFGGILTVDAIFEEN
jgi:Uma2 family endonuclease